jgi:LYR motif-containing protein 2-like
VKVQQYFRKNVITKQYRPRLVDAKLKKARKVRILFQCAFHYIFTDMKELRRLRRANEGDRKALQQVLDLAYGRQGKLKHELMKVRDLCVVR